MKYVILSISLFGILSSSDIKAQASTDTSITGKKLHIDSLVMLTDSNKMLTQNVFVGSLAWGQFNANVFHLVGIAAINKAEYFFKEGNAGKKIFYYYHGQLIKIIDNGVEYYYAKLLYDKNGKPLKDYMAKDLIFFSQESYKMMLALIQ